MTKVDTAVRAFTRSAPGPDPRPIAARLARAATVALGRELAQGGLVVEDAAGAYLLGRTTPEVHVRVHDARTYSAVLGHGTVGLGQSYIDGWWECDDLTRLFQLLLRSRGTIGRLQDRLGDLAGRLSTPVRRLRPPSPSRDRHNVRAHYDLGNEFFALMLDPTMSYSCALFERPDVSLEQASIAKMDRICAKLALSPRDHLIEIGTGWGGFALHAATRYGCRVTSTTVSTEQYAYATKKVAELGLADRVTILQEDYRALRGRYDKLVSIEMVEAVDWRDLPSFFSTCAALLRPDGLMALQAITIDEAAYERAKNGRDFIKAFIFPGSCLPSISALSAVAAGTDLRIVGLEDIGRHYAETLRRWRARLDAHRSEIDDLDFDERFVRMWRFYLSYCEAGFLERRVSDVQMVLAKPRWRPSLALVS